MNTEKFEEILRSKFDRGVHTFNGKATGATYEIQHYGTSKRGYTLFKDQKPIRVKTTFYDVACTIYDYEVRR